MIDLHVNLEGSIPVECAHYIGKKYNLSLGLNFPKSFELNFKEPSRDDFLSKSKLAKNEEYNKNREHRFSCHVYFFLG